MTATLIPIMTHQEIIIYSSLICGVHVLSEVNLILVLSHCDLFFIFCWQGEMIILDLYSEIIPIYTQTESYYGQPFIWCMLHDFGGTMELYGALKLINEVGMRLTRLTSK